MDSPSQVDVLVPIVMGSKYGDATAGEVFRTNTHLRHSFYIKADRGNRGYNFPQLELVQNGCLPRRCFWGKYIKGQICEQRNKLAYLC